MFAVTRLGGVFSIFGDGEDADAKARALLRVQQQEREVRALSRATEVIQRRLSDTGLKDGC